MIQLSFLQKTLGFIFPVKVWKGSSSTNPVLELFFFRGEWQLGTINATYSNGTRYRPLYKSFSQIKPALPDIKKVLVLGAGLGSASSILSKMGFSPNITLVDVDEVIINLARKIKDPLMISELEFICQDAQAFIMANSDKYDLVVIDIFNSRNVPEFVGYNSFLQNCRNALGDNGYVILNYIINNPEEWEAFINNFRQVFPATEIIKIGMNRVLVAKV